MILEGYFSSWAGTPDWLDMSDYPSIRYCNLGTKVCTVLHLHMKLKFKSLSISTYTYWLYWPTFFADRSGLWVAMGWDLRFRGIISLTFKLSEPHLIKFLYYLGDWGWAWRLGLGVRRPWGLRTVVEFVSAAGGGVENQPAGRAGRCSTVWGCAGLAGSY